MTRAREYLKNTRHLTDETIETFNLSYCDLSGDIYTQVSSGITDMKLDPRFKDSVMFPIYNLYNDLIAISSRSLQNNPDIPKYVNTIYSKGQHLYGFQETWKTCLQEQKVYVVEGNVDMLVMWQNGIKNVVGMLGSNLTLTQICLLKRFVKHIVLVPDGDNAGVKFLNKLQEAIPRKYNNINLDFSTVTLPTKYDPDKFLFEFGKDAFLKLESNLFLSLQDKLQKL